MNQQIIHGYKKSNQRRYRKLRDESYSTMVIKTPTKDRRSRRNISNSIQSADRNAFLDPMISTPMCPRELYSGRSEKNSRNRAEDWEMIESPPPLRGYAKRNTSNRSQHEASSYYTQVEQRDCAEYSNYHDQSSSQNVFHDLRANTSMCPRELSLGENSRPSCIHAEDRDATEAHPPLRDNVKRNIFDRPHNERSSCYGQVEQRDCPEYATFQNCSKERPRKEQSSYDTVTSACTDTRHESRVADNTILSPPRLRKASPSYASTKKSHQDSFRLERGHSRKPKGESRSFPMQTRHYSINEVRLQAHRPLVPLYGYRNVGNPSLGIIRLRLPDRYLTLLDQSKFKISYLTPICYHSSIS